MSTVVESDDVLGVPLSTRSPSGPYTSTEPGRAVTASVKVIVTSSGTVSTTLSVLGLVDTNEAWAPAGDATPNNVMTPTAPATARRTANPQRLIGPRRVNGCRR